MSDLQALFVVCALAYIASVVTQCCSKLVDIKYDVRAILKAIVGEKDLAELGLTKKVKP